MRRYREDGERLVRLRGYYVRRPQAYRVGPEPASWKDVREALAGLVVLVLFGAAFWLWIAIAAAAQT